MKALGRGIDPLFVVTLSTPSVSHRILFTEALLCVKHSVYFHLMAQYQYHTKAVTEYMEKYLEELHHHKDVFSQFRTSQSTEKVTEAWKKHHTLDKQTEQESDPTWTNLSVAAKQHHVDEDTMQMKSEILQCLVDKSDFNFVKMHPLHHFIEHVHQLRNLSNASSEVPQTSMMDLQHV